LADEHVPFRPTTSGPFVTFTAPITVKSRLLAQPIASIAFAHASLDAAGRPVANGPSDGLRSAALTLFAEYGFDDDTAFGAQLAAIHNDRAGASSSGLGELVLFGRRVLFTEKSWGLPEATILMQVKVPTGNAEGTGPLQGTDLRGSGSADLTFGIDLTRGLRPVLVHADLLVTHPLPARVAGVDTHYGDALSWAASVEWPFWLDHLGVMLELSGRHQLTPTLNGVKAAAGHADEIIVGGGVEILFSPDLQLLVGYQRTIWGRNVGAFDTLIVTLVPSFF
jgi:hypothetical protein